MSSGYWHCSCRDCFELLVGLPGEECEECIEAGCEADAECQRADAYGVGEEEEDE
jgi:hypothetical protein